MSTVRLTVKWWNDSKGYGYLTDSSGRNIFAHYTAIMNEGGFKTLVDGEIVTAEVIDGPKGPQALDIWKVNQYE